MELGHEHHEGFRTRIRRWAYHLNDGVVDVSILLLALVAVNLLMAPIAVTLTQFLRLAGGHENLIPIIAGAIYVVGLAIAFPMIIVFACIADFLEKLVGTRCPCCGMREMEWRSGHWTYGEPPAHCYFACSSCGARFRRLYGGQGVLSDFELD